jgi:uncharacterized membrane protein YdcZ (DUF606 family)
MKKTTASLRDWLLYLGTGLLIAGSAVAYGMLSAPGSKFPLGTVWLVVLTLIVFGYAAKGLRRFWHRARFWALFGGLLGLHVLLLRFVMVVMGSHYLLLTSLLAGPEVLVVCGFLDLAMRKDA